MLLFVRMLLAVVCRLLFVGFVSGLMFACRCLLLFACCLLFVVCCLLVAGCCMLFVV